LKIINNFVLPSGFLEEDIYENLLQDIKWKAKCEEIFTRDGGACVVCKSPKNLVVHFRQYHFSRMLQSLILPWNYKNSYLVTLCQDCHREGHNNYKIPIKEVN
jgi:5-methylcytosine-specific restriction endonuclease McrA